MTWYLTSGSFMKVQKSVVICDFKSETDRDQLLIVHCVVINPKR